MVLNKKQMYKTAKINFNEKKEKTEKMKTKHNARTQQQNLTSHYTTKQLLYLHNEQGNIAVMPQKYPIIFGSNQR